MRSLNSSVSIVTGIRVGRPWGRGSIPGRDKRASLLRNVEGSSVAHPAWSSMGISVSFPRVKRPGCEDDRSRPSSGEYKNEWSYTSTPYGVMQYKRAVTVNVMSVSNCVPQSELSVGFL